MDKRLKELEKKIGYTFENHKLLERAMMHSSYTNEKHLEKYSFRVVISLKRSVEITGCSEICDYGREICAAVLF